MIKYKKGSTNLVADMLSRPPTQEKFSSLATISQIEPFTKEAYGEAYAQDKDFGVTFQQLQSQGAETIGIEDFYLKDGLLYQWGKICVPK